MAGQEFLASFAVEIDEAGVSRLKQVLEENRELADEAAAAFEAAAAAAPFGTVPGCPGELGRSRGNFFA